MRDPSISAEEKEELDGLTIIDCDNVIAYMFEETDQEEWNSSHFPNIAPPLDRFWMDCSAPKFILSKDHGQVGWPPFSAANWGLYCVSKMVKTEEDRVDLLHDPVWQSYEDHFRPYVSQAKWGMDIYLNWQINGKIETNVWSWHLFIDERGQMVKDRQGNDIISCASVGETTNAMIELGEQTSSHEEALATVYKFVAPLLHAGFLALSFMHCHNIVVDDVFPAFVPVHNKSQKRRGEKPYQPVPYKILNIGPMTRIIKDAQRSHQVSAPKALHFCRGNFATYGEENKLFGKYVGTFWRPMTIRGRKESGITTKGYKIMSPKKV